MKKIKRERHGITDTSLYGVWEAMKQRCSNPKCKQYRDYGGRGIKVCDDWQKFISFMNWATNNGYSDKLQIDRIDNNKGYNPKNCRFVNRKINQNNTRSNRKIMAFSETKNLSEWVEDPRCKVKYNTLLYRIRKYGMDPERAIIEKKKFSGNTSKYRGVFYDKLKRKFHASIKINYQKIFIGRFSNEVDAAIAYNSYAARLLGDKAKLNTV